MLWWAVRHAQVFWCTCEHVACLGHGRWTATRAEASMVFFMANTAWQLTCRCSAVHAFAESLQVGAWGEIAVAAVRCETL